MRRISSIPGRRQFLISAGVGSTSALTLKLAAGVFGPVFQTGAANASDGPVSSKATGENKKYRHLLSPFKIGNTIVKNRMLYAVSTPAFLQGPETYPSDVIRSYYARIAKGAAIVNCKIEGGGQPRKERLGDMAHEPIFDTSDPAVENYIDQLVEGVHCMGSLVSGGSIGGGPGGGNDIVTQAKLLEDRGFDVVSMRITDLKDKDRMRLAFEQMQEVKKATNLIIMIPLVVIAPSVRPKTSDSGQNLLSVITLDDAVAAAKMYEGVADILYISSFTGMNTFPTGFNQEKDKPVNLEIAQAIKESGAKIIVCPNGGFGDPDMNDEFIAGGKADMIAMARPFIADSDYGKKVYEGRGADVVPCIMCNKCMVLTLKGPWYNVCSVNPKLGLESATKVIDPPSTFKKVAVIGGGPAGMTAAITAAERGHRVTLYEKNSYLGGLLRHADFFPFKWALKDFKDYLIRQVKKEGVKVLLNTEATADMIASEGYDAVLTAIGAELVIPDIPGVKDANVWNINNFYGREKDLGKSVVLVGGGDIGVETGMYLAASGHKTTVITNEKELLHIDGVHYTEQIVDAYEHLENFNYVMGAEANRISGGKVSFIDEMGNEKTIRADSVIVYGGRRPRQDEALNFFGAAKNAFFAVGDCSGNGGDVQKSVRTAFFAASQI